MESTGFAFLDLIAIALIIAMIVHPYVSGVGYDKVGTPNYVILIGVRGALAAALMAYIGAYITIAGASLHCQLTTYTQQNIWCLDITTRPQL